MHVCVKLHEKLKWFSETTTAHGFAQIRESQSTFKKVFWSIICIAGFTAVTIHLTILLQHFFSYPKAVTIQESSEPVPFPQVTICVSTTWAHARLSTDPVAMATLNYMIKQLNETLKSTIPDEETRMASVNQILVENAMSAQRNSTGVFSKDLQKLGSYLLQLDEILITCKFDNKPCNTSQQFSEVRSSIFPKCFKFIPQSGDTEARNFLTGLDILLYIPEEKIIEDHSHPIGITNGLILYILDRNTHPNYQRESPILASVGSYSNFGVSFTYVNRISTPNDHCATHHELLESYDKGHKVERFEYNPADCTDGWANQNILTNCNCVVPHLPIQPKMNNYKACLQVVVNDNNTLQNSAEIQQQYNCMQTIIKNLLTEPTISARCIKSCKITELTKEISYISLPSYPKQIDGYSEKIIARYLFLNQTNRPFAQDLETVLNAAKTQLKNTQVLKQFFAQINIFLKSSAVTIYTESVSYTAISFISEVGGVVGLWIGGSILTIIEFGQLAVILTSLLCKRFQTKPVETAIVDMDTKRQENNNSPISHTSILNSDAEKQDKISTIHF